MSHALSRVHRTLHRPKRDTQRARESTDLKRENHQLKRTVARLRKQLDQAELLQDDEIETFEECSPAPSARRCPECSSFDLISVPLPTGRVLNGCRACQWRE